MQAALDAGATLVGKTQLDECAFSLHGVNVHYGTPRNPACPDRIPGGSSSGSVVSLLVTCRMHDCSGYSPAASADLHEGWSFRQPGGHISTFLLWCKGGHQLGLLMDGCRGCWRALQGAPVGVWGACRRTAWLGMR